MQENVFLPLQQDFYSKSRHASPQNSSQIYAYELGLGSGFSLGTARVHTHATCKRHVEKVLTFEPVVYSLGAQHDGTMNECQGRNQYVMASAPSELTDNNFKNALTFSHCSVRYFREHMNKLNRLIFRTNASTTGRNVPRLLQCRR